jgi:hypothetical protein
LTSSSSLPLRRREMADTLGTEFLSQIPSLISLCMESNLLKGLGHEIEFNYFDQEWIRLGLNRKLSYFFTFKMSLCSLLQGLLKMKLSSGKLQFWGCKKPPVDSGTFCPSPILLFYILTCWKYLPVSGARPSPCCYRKIP